MILGCEWVHRTFMCRSSRPKKILYTFNIGHIPAWELFTHV